MTSRRSFLKAICFFAGGATIASKAVSAILTRPENKNALAGIPDTQNGRLGGIIKEDWPLRKSPWLDMADPFPRRCNSYSDALEGKNFLYYGDKGWESAPWEERANLWPD